MRSKPTVNIEVDAEEIDLFRADLISLRDEALDKYQFERAIVLSHIIAHFSNIKETLNGKN